MDRIPIYRPMLGVEEKVQLIDCVDAEWLTGGKKVKEFEQNISDLEDEINDIEDDLNVIIDDLKD